jgi:uncharacterized RDD family membrane protein YckC
MAKDKKLMKIKSHKSHADITLLENSYLIERAKAFIVDMFMIMMPIMYITTYILMDGKNDFQSNEIARWATAFVFGFVLCAFWKISGQSPGLKAYDLKLVDASTCNNISWPKSFLRYLIFIFSAVTILGLFLPFFRKDKRTIQDIIANTKIISVERKI